MIVEALCEFFKRPIWIEARAVALAFFYQIEGFTVGFFQLSIRGGPRKQLDKVMPLS